jgi:hypothetical protein
MPAAFTLNLDRRSRLPGQRRHRERQQFGHAQACGETHMQHGAVANPGARSEIRDVQERLHLGDRQVLDQRLIRLLGRDSQDPSDLLQQGRSAVFQEVHERLDRGQAGIPCAGAVASFGLQ